MLASERDIEPNFWTVVAVGLALHPSSPGASTGDRAP
jgi:hypothetical protein